MQAGSHTAQPVAGSEYRHITASRFRPILLGLFLISQIIFGGCVLPRHTAQVTSTQAYHRQNVFVAGRLSPQIRRVAVLPMTCDQDVPDAIKGRDALEPVLLGELVRLKRFEVIPLSCVTLRAKTGQSFWNCEETLPGDLFSWMEQSQGCDAVLFCKLTVFRGYAPLAVGWRMRLVDLRTRATLWASDEVFDADGQRPAPSHLMSVVREACGIPVQDWEISNSPRQFGQSAAAQLLATLPGL